MNINYGFSRCSITVYVDEEEFGSMNGAGYAKKIGDLFPNVDVEIQPGGPDGAFDVHGEDPKKVEQLRALVAEIIDGGF
jgi:hypothetical protein